LNAASSVLGQLLGQVVIPAALMKGRFAGVAEDLWIIRMRTLTRKS